MRNRLVVSVALCSAAVLGAGTPGIVGASQTLTESQELVTQATLHQRAIALSHSLSDERGDMVEYVASGRTGEDGAGAGAATDSQRARVDRQTAELLAADGVAPPLRQSLQQLPEARQEALTSDGTAYDAFQAYTAVIQQLQGISRSVARGLPGDHTPGSTAAAAVATTESLPHLGRAVAQASATRGLLRGAFAGDGPARTLTEAARLAHVREQGALADFEQTAGSTASETYGKTVTGTDVGLAERYIEQLTADPVLDPKDRALNTGRVMAALSARIDRMRSVQASLATAEVARLEQQRDDDVVALELAIGLVGVCLLLAVGVSVYTARSLSRPLSVLRRGSKRLASADQPDIEEPVRFHGRNDEFAEVVGSLNELRETAADLHSRAREAEADNTHLTAARDDLTAERAQLQEEGDRLRARLEAAQVATHGTFVHLGLRTLGLVERQLAILEVMEAEESDPEDLATLFKLDHLATRTRRAGENLLLLAGAEHAVTHHAGPVPLLDVLRAAVSEIERYERVQIASLPPHAQVSGFAADDLSHLVAELLDNATAFSAPDAEVTLSAWMLENGDIMLSVQDEGIGVAPDRLAELNARLGDPAAQEAPGSLGEEEPELEGLGNGLYVVARLAARHGLRVQLREQRQGGVAVVVVVPRALLPDRPVPGVAGVWAASGGGQSLPGSVAEANSNALPMRRTPVTAGAPDSDTPAPTPDFSDEAPTSRAGDTVEAADAADSADEAAVPSDETTHGELSPSSVTPQADEVTEPAAGAAEEDAGRVEDRPQKLDRESSGATGHPFGGPAVVPEPREPVDGTGATDDAGVHERAASRSEDDTEGDTEGDTEHDTEPDTEPDTEHDTGQGAREHPSADDGRRDVPVVTDKGLPKRNPRVVVAEPQVRPANSGGTNAEELRRRLGGFQRGARDGHRDAAAEVTAQGAADADGTDEEAQQ
ncbi:hypothetical protein N566_06105 [Streptomycetaceae bacterium MP113-05]|nr:hypothetical protein N566_06105 [Streptomycetaceae bacterium MP113-05]